MDSLLPTGEAISCSPTFNIGIENDKRWPKVSPLQKSDRHDSAIEGKGSQHGKPITDFFVRKKQCISLKGSWFHFGFNSLQHPAILVVVPVHDSVVN